MAVQLDAGVGIAGFGSKGRDLAVADGYAGLITEPLEDRQRLLVAALGLAVVPSALGQHAQLAAAAGCAVLVTELLGDGQ